MSVAIFRGVAKLDLVRTAFVQWIVASGIVARLVSEVFVRTLIAGTV